MARIGDSKKFEKDDIILAIRGCFLQYLGIEVLLSPFVISIMSIR